MRVGRLRLIDRRQLSERILVAADALQETAQTYPRFGRGFRPGDGRLVVLANLHSATGRVLLLAHDRTRKNEARFVGKSGERLIDERARRCRPDRAFEQRQHGEMPVALERIGLERMPDKTDEARQQIVCLPPRVGVVRGERGIREFDGEGGFTLRRGGPRVSRTGEGAQQPPRIAGLADAVHDELIAAACVGVGELADRPRGRRRRPRRRVGRGLVDAVSLPRGDRITV